MTNTITIYCQEQGPRALLGGDVAKKLKNEIAKYERSLDLARGKTREAKALAKSAPVSAGAQGTISGGITSIALGVLHERKGDTWVPAAVSGVTGLVGLGVGALMLYNDVPGGGTVYGVGNAGAFISLFSMGASGARNMNK